MPSTLSGEKLSNVERKPPFTVTEHSQRVWFVCFISAQIALKVMWVWDNFHYWDSPWTITRCWSKFRAISISNLSDSKSSVPLVTLGFHNFRNETVSKAKLRFSWAIILHPQLVDALRVFLLIEISSHTARNLISVDFFAGWRLRSSRPNPRKLFPHNTNLRCELQARRKFSLFCNATTMNFVWQSLNLELFILQLVRIADLWNFSYSLFDTSGDKICALCWHSNLYRYKLKLSKKFKQSFDIKIALSDNRGDNKDEL